MGQPRPTTCIDSPGKIHRKTGRQEDHWSFLPAFPTSSFALPTYRPAGLGCEIRCWFRAPAAAFAAETRQSTTFRDRSTPAACAEIRALDASCLLGQPPIPRPLSPDFGGKGGLSWKRLVRAGAEEPAERSACPPCSLPTSACRARRDAT